MPLNSMEGRLRPPVELIIRTGVKKRNASNREYPSEVDFFVFPWGQPTEQQRKEHGDKAEQRIDPRTLAEVRELYGDKPKRLRMMLYAEWDQADATGREIALPMNNEAWGAGGLKCTGTGEDQHHPGIAQTRDPEWAQRIANRTHVQPQPIARAWRRIACWGSDCPKMVALAEGPREGDKKMALGHDEDAACKPIMRLRAWLLHPATETTLPNGERNPNYMRPLCFVQLTSSSWNAMLNLRGRFQVLRALATRSSFVPFDLVRPATETKHGGRTQTHWPLDITFNVEEVQSIGILHPSRILLPPELREQAARLAEAAPAHDFEAVKHLYSYADQERVESSALPRLRAPVGPSEGGGAATPPPVTDPDRDAVLEEAEGNAELSQAQRDALKVLVGLRDDRDPERGPKLQRLATATAQVMAELGEEVPSTWPEILAGLRARHEEPLRRLLQEQQQAEHRDVAELARAQGW
jgi:Recombination directionality factor-like